MAIGRSNFHVASLTHFKHYNLTTILITINLQQKSVLLQRIFKKCVSPRIHYQRYASLALFLRNHVLFTLHLSNVPDNRKSILPADVSHVSKLRTTYLRFVPHSPLSFTRNSLERDSKECPKYVFFLAQASISTVHCVYSRFRLRQERVYQPFLPECYKNLEFYRRSVAVHDCCRLIKSKSR